MFASGTYRSAWCSSMCCNSWIAWEFLVNFRQQLLLWKQQIGLHFSITKWIFLPRKLDNVIKNQYKWSALLTIQICAQRNIISLNSGILRREIDFGTEFSPEIKLQNCPSEMKFTLEFCSFWLAKCILNSNFTVQPKYFTHSQVHFSNSVRIARLLVNIFRRFSFILVVLFLTFFHTFRNVEASDCGHAVITQSGNNFQNKSCGCLTTIIPNIRTENFVTCKECACLRLALANTMPMLGITMSWTSQCVLFFASRQHCLVAGCLFVTRFFLITHQWNTCTQLKQERNLLFSSCAHILHLYAIWLLIFRAYVVWSSYSISLRFADLMFESVYFLFYVIVGRVAALPFLLPVTTGCLFLRLLSRRRSRGF